MAHSSWRILIIFCFLLSACGSTPSLSPTESLPATNSIPTLTDTPEPIPTMTVTGFDGYQTTLREYPSPDGSFTARTIVALPNEGQPQFFSRLEIEGSQGVHVIRERWSSWAMGYSVPIILGWSSDGRFLYFAEHISSDGCSFFSWIQLPMRLEVPNGLPETLGIEVYGPAALSPGGNYLAMILNGELVMADLIQGSQEHIPIPITGEAQAGAIVWSPQEDQLAFTVLYHPCSGTQPESLIFVSAVPELNAELVFHQEDVILRSTGWLDATTLLLHDFNNQAFVLNLETGELREE